MVTVLKFSADWCGPCQQLKKIIDGMDSSVPIVEVNVDEAPEMASQYKIRGVPTLLAINEDSQEISRKVGMITEQTLKDWLNTVSDTNVVS